MPPRGKYRVVTFTEGLTEDQEDFLAGMMDMVLWRSHLIDLAQDSGMDGVIVQHEGGGGIYKIMDGNFIFMHE